MSDDYKEIPLKKNPVQHSITYKYEQAVRLLPDRKARQFKSTIVFASYWRTPLIHSSHLVLKSFHPGITSGLMAHTPSLPTGDTLMDTP
ncbi:hypothetical protein [Pseudomonas sp. dw_358]|uniref:hypothetical protein n=1 Tax=Pseudomonas sp. dw_358 TaxID=2720083 RepID=UPI001BD2DAC3|nr:hypothetical protein [Pseudomonas sp. dw_358]